MFTFFERLSLAVALLFGVVCMYMGVSYYRKAVKKAGTL